MTLNWIWLLVAFCAGAAIAAGITLAVARPKGGKKSIAELKETHETYRDDVATHFVDTAKLVNEMTDSYKALFDHLQTGAEQLLDESTLREKLTADAEEIITLSRLGHRINGSATAATAAAAADLEDNPPTEDIQADMASEEPAAAETGDPESAQAEEVVSEPEVEASSEEPALTAEAESADGDEAGVDSEITEVSGPESAQEDREVRPA